MNILQLIEQIGVDNVNVQSVQTATVKIADKKRTKDTEITIATNEINANDYATNTGKVGLIIWLDGEKARPLLS